MANFWYSEKKDGGDVGIHTLMDAGTQLIFLIKAAKSTTNALDMHERQYSWRAQTKELKPGRAGRTQIEIHL